MVQWRMKGEAFIVGEDIEGEDEQSKESSGVRTAKSEIGSRMRVVKEEGRDQWSWKRELVGHFGNISPGMRGSFKNPPPGQPVDQPYDTNLKTGEKVTTLDDPVSRSNFRVVVIKPEEVESTDLSDPVKARRQRYTYEKSTGKWTHVETWP
ncbi:26S proteasome regulatory subunit [Hortaea werneckii]|nr:26S proteasome regulatory subunit [Hortaea werneckii]KAI6915489.1 26S proteasome regulatory subunit [Hortaea werneckii]KAI7648460.1 26S proteasome regulatory subunit [Hortaea werneckii]